MGFSPAGLWLAALSGVEVLDFIFDKVMHSCGVN